MAVLDSLEVVGPEDSSVRAEADSHVHLPNNRCGSSKDLGLTAWSGCVDQAGDAGFCRPEPQLSEAMLRYRALGIWSIS
jgi:hypothetical protein